MDSLFDNVMERASKMTSNIVDAAEKMAGDKPLGAKTIPGREVVEIMRGLQPQEIDMLVQEFGPDVMNNVLFDVYKAEQRLKPESVE